MDVQKQHGWTTYRSRRRLDSGDAARFEARYRPLDDAPADDAFARWATERYCLYAHRRGRVFRGEIHHEPWPLRRAEAHIQDNTMLASLGIGLPPRDPVLHYAERRDVVAWALQAVGSSP